MTVPAESWVVAWLATYLLHSTVLVVAVLAAARWLERDPELASGAWKLALFGGLATATLQLALGGGPNVARVELTATEPATPLVAAPEMVAEAELVGSALELADVPTFEVSEPAAAEPAPAPAALRVPSWHAAVAGVVLGGAALGLLSVVAAAVALRRRTRERAPLSVGMLATMLARLQSRAGTRRRVSLAVAPRLDVPLAVGVLRPAILVPPRALSELSAQEQETMLAHELAHVLRGDPLWRYAALAVRRALAIQPLNRLAAVRMARAAELACDDWAARATSQPLELARCLTEVAGWSVDRRMPQLGSAMARPGDALRGRVARLLDHDRGRRRAPLRIAAALAGLALPLFAWLAPGVTVACEHHRAHASTAAPRAVVLSIEDGDIEVIADGDARPVVATAADEPPRAATGSERKAVAKAHRIAKKQMRKAFRDARKAGRPAPTDAEVDAILGRARGDERRKGDEGRERVRVRIVTDEGELVLEIDGDGRAIRQRSKRNGGREQARAEAIRALALAQAHRERAHAHALHEHVRAHAQHEHARAQQVAERARRIVAAHERAAREQAHRIEALAREHERRARGKQRQIEQLMRELEHAPRPPARAPRAPVPPQPPGTWWISTPPAPAPPPSPPPFND